MDDNEDYLLVGEFNLIKRPINCNKPSDHLQEMLRFNSPLSTLALEERSIKGNENTQSNNYTSPVLECLDCAFALVSWVIQYPSSKILTLSKEGSNHVPCLTKITKYIPKSRVRFEKEWLNHEQSGLVFQHGWQQALSFTDPVRRIVAKFKILRKNLRTQQHSIASLASLIAHNKLVLKFLDTLEVFRDLSLFLNEILEILLGLLKQQNGYWRKQSKIKWETFGHETKRSFMLRQLLSSIVILCPT